MTIAERITESAKHLDALLVILEEAEPRTRASAAARTHYDKEANRLMHELFRGQSDEGQYEIIHALHNARKSAWRLRHWIASAELVDAIPTGNPCTVIDPEPAETMALTLDQEVRSTPLVIAAAQAEANARTIEERNATSGATYAAVVIETYNRLPPEIRDQYCSNYTPGNFRAYLDRIGVTTGSEA